MLGTPATPSGYERSLERHLDMTLFERGGLALEPSAAAGLVRGAMSRSDLARATYVTEAAERLASHRTDQPSLAAAARHARGVLTGDAELLVQAAHGYADPWQQASAAEDAGVVLLNTGHRQQAVEQLSRARTGYESVNAATDLDRVRARLRALGVRVRHWSVGQRPTFGWESLTATERRVVRWVADGLTNRQIAEQMFLSPHTVAFHLRQVFRKLGISSRVQLARLAVELGGEQDGPHPNVAG